MELPVETVERYLVMLNGATEDPVSISLLVTPTVLLATPALPTVEVLEPPPSFGASNLGKGDIG